MLREKYPSEVDAILAKYPPDQKRAAVMPLLYLAQRERNFLTKQDLIDVAEVIGISPTDVASITGFYTLYHDEPGGKYRIQVCTDLPCALRGAEEFFEKLCENLGIHVNETTPDGLVSVEAVTCLAGCHRAPLFQVQSGQGLEYHENQTVESAMALIEQWRARESDIEKLPPDKAEQVRRFHIETPVLPVVEGGTTSMSQDERVKIMREGGQ